jgi:hypothetical protein
MGAMFAAPFGGANEISRLACAWLGRQDSQPVSRSAKSLILLTQKSFFASKTYSELAQFFKAPFHRFSMVSSGTKKGIGRTRTIPRSADGTHGSTQSVGLRARSAAE